MTVGVKTSCKAILPHRVTLIQTTKRTNISHLHNPTKTNSSSFHLLPYHSVKNISTRTTDIVVEKKDDLVLNLTIFSHYLGPKDGDKGWPQLTSMEVLIGGRGDVCLLVTGPRL